jgi:monovalent cation:H+ antiporter-2, CPA2 family
VLAANGRENDILSNDQFQLFITSSLVTLLLTPTLVRHARSLARRLTRTPRHIRDPSHTHGAPPDKLVLVIGYGPAGKEVVQALQEGGFHPRILDHNPRTVHAARGAGVESYLGDAASPEVLHHSGVDHALGVAIAVPDFRAAAAIIQQCRRLAPDTPVVVRCRYSTHASDLESAGAHVVVDEEDTVGRLLGWQVLRAATDRLAPRESNTVIIQEEAMP